MLPLLNLVPDPSTIASAPPDTEALARSLCARLSFLRCAAATDGTGKKKVDGTLANTRLGSAVTEQWANERFRQTMLLVREFRLEWPNMTLLTADDVDTISWLLDCVLHAATLHGHEADVYDMNPTCWAIWLVQNQCSLKADGWVTSSEFAQQKLSFEGLYRWLEAQHARGDDHSLYDHVTRQLIKRYKRYNAIEISI